LPFTPVREAGPSPGAAPKQYAQIGGIAVLARTLEVFLQHAQVDLVQVVISAAHHALYAAAVPANHAKLVPAVVGGDTRQQSVHLGLIALGAHAPDRVLIHDAVRPFVDGDLLTRVLEALGSAAGGPAGAIAAIPVADTLKRCGDNGDVVATVAREGLWRAQTPQGFRYGEIMAAHAAAAAAGQSDLTDDAAVASWAGLRVVVVGGSEANRKLTTAHDMAHAQRMLAAPVADVRTGTGLDVHGFTAGDHVWLCGVRIPYTKALRGHSDADPALHALTDALLGAIADGDIGEHFPDSDPRWRGASSHIFAADAARRVRALGGKIANVDVTILCELPRIGPHRAAMRARIAEILAIDIARISVKATTTEGLGFLGRGEGIATLATATVLIG
jgi:2-C-methyl-D-erythritol 4-phosphate cytidylyltransferase / 2-C-methyl-D-erythritol 2,4-cyclodiphosphate synthase